MIRVYAYLAALAVVIGAMLYIDHRGYERGKMACQAERAANVEKVQQAIDLRDQRSADVRVDMLDYLRVTVPPIEIRTHDTIERIRVVYKYRAIPADCAASIARPQRVSDELNAARESANKAVSSVRRTTPIPDPRSP